MRIQYIIHADFELPGIIEEWAKQNKFTESFCRPFAGEKVPIPNDYDILILMGGPQSPRNMAESPYLKDEISLIKKTIKAHIPILGFCLGAQLIGEALGASTEQSPNKEVGVFPIELTEEGHKDPILRSLPKQFLVVHWHNDMPGITPEARILATSKGCPRQIIRYSPLIYGFQCHPEPTKKNIESMIQHCPNDLAPGKFIQSCDEFLNNDFTMINKRMIQILDSLINSTKCLEADSIHSII
jgi:GMP synthase (glutamine-hydrolysing)